MAKPRAHASEGALARECNATRWQALARVHDPSPSDKVRPVFLLSRFYPCHSLILCTSFALCAATLIPNFLRPRIGASGNATTEPVLLQISQGARDRVWPNHGTESCPAIRSLARSRKRARVYWCHASFWQRRSLLNESNKRLVCGLGLQCASGSPAGGTTTAAAAAKPWQ